MPRIHVQVCKGLTDEQKENLILTIANTVSENLKRPRSIVRVFIDEYDPQNISVDGASYKKHMAEGKFQDISTQDILITLYIMAGRDKDAKQSLVADITDAVEKNIGFDRKNMRIYFMDLITDNFAVNGTTSTRKKELEAAK